MKQNKLPLGYIEISKKNLVHNFLSFRKLLPKGMKISAVVKSNAYGHGIEEVVRILNPYADYFQINSVEELERVRKITKKPILVLGYVQKGDIRRALKLKPILSVLVFRLARQTAQPWRHRAHAAVAGVRRRQI